MKINMELFSKYKSIFLVVVISFLSVFPLLHQGLMPTHDGEYHVIRFYEFNKVLLDGELYPRWAPDLNNGFGVPLFNYVYPFPNYFASFLKALSVNAVDAVNLNMFFATIIGSVFFYLWAKEYWGEKGAVVSSAFYSFSPYRLLDIYVRGSVGEVWAMVFFPMLLWSFVRFEKTAETKFFYLSTVSLALLIYSHNILALMFFVFFFVYCLFIIKKNKSNFFSLFSLFFIGFGLAAPFWIPALFEKNFVVGLEVFDVTKHFPQLYELILPSWGSGFSGMQALDKMSFQIGVANIIGLLFVLGKFFDKRRESYKEKGIVAFFIISFIVVFFLMLEYSSWFWKNVPLLSFFQFPWRLLSLEIVIASFLVGSLFKNMLLTKKNGIIFTLSVLGVISLGINYAKPPFYHMRDESHYITRSNFIDGTNSVGNVFNTKWLREIPDKQNAKVLASGKISNLALKSTEYLFDIENKNNSEVLINTAYFPGWTISSDGLSIPVKNVDGKIGFELTKGDHRVDVRLESTIIQKLSYLYFLLSVLLLFSIRRVPFFDIIKR